jgi:hypothetical protein
MVALSVTDFRSFVSLRRMGPIVPSPEPYLRADAALLSGLRRQHRTSEAEG